jgi:2-polyprenyl-6-methoxyphenol hydroxylase-like FAD-dependent oxidoreductase
VAGVTLALEDVKNLGEALQEMKNGKQQNELKLACNAAYAG